MDLICLILDIKQWMDLYDYFWKKAIDIYEINLDVQDFQSHEKK